MKNLILGAKSGDHFVFHCEFLLASASLTKNHGSALVSGHGSQVQNLDGTEVDGYDEGTYGHITLYDRIASSAHGKPVIWPVDVNIRKGRNGEDKVRKYIIDDVSALRILGLSLLLISIDFHARST